MPGDTGGNAGAHWQTGEDRVVAPDKMGLATHGFLQGCLAETRAAHPGGCEHPDFSAVVACRTSSPMVSTLAVAHETGLRAICRAAPECDDLPAPGFPHRK